MQFFKFRGHEGVKVVHKYNVIFYYTNIACYNEIMIFKITMIILYAVIVIVIVIKSTNNNNAYYY